MREEWMQHGRCREVDPELFFPERMGANAIHAAYRKAVSICSRCEVRAECYAYAYDNNIQDGIWGGHYAQQIRKAKRKASK
jgi:WhiB family redox-sensing transcriptional regulator